MGLVTTLSSGRRELPSPPPDIAQEVELYARESGRHATLRFVPNDILRKSGDGTWVVRFTLRSDDKRLLISQEQRARGTPTEDVWLHVPDSESQSGYRALDLQQLGVSGVREFLQRGNTWSGRGEFVSLEEQARKAMEANEKMLQKHRADQKEASRKQVGETRRRRLKIPFLPVGIDLSKRSEV